MPSPSKRQLAAIMFTDMVGYTALMQQNEQLAIQKRDRSKKIFEESLAKHDGKLLQYYGDGTMSIFSSAVNAVRSAIEMQTLFLTEPKVDVRIGLHIGDVMFDDNGIYGDSVNVASRIESLATPGGVFISEKLFDEVKNNEGISTKSLGYFELKNVKHPMQVYAITNPGLVIPAREDLRGKTKTVSNGIAVLPFSSLSSDPENEFFCDGMTEELINVLAKVDGLQVTSRTSAFAFKGKNEDVREIAAKLNVQKIIEGSVRKAGNKIRVTAQLINAADGNHFWSETYDRNLEDIFGIQDDIARAIANKLRENLTTDQHQSQLAKAPTENLEAYKKYLQGLYYWNKQTLPDMLNAIAAFEQAVVLQPDFANPYFYITYMNWFFAFVGVFPSEDSTARLVAAAENAMKYDPENPYSLVASGIAKISADWDFDGGLKAFQQALAINPNLQVAYVWTSYYHTTMLDMPKAVAAMETAFRLDPLSGFSMASMAEIYLHAKKYDEAIEISAEALAFDPTNIYALNMNGIATTFKYGWEKGLEIFTELNERVKDFPIIMVMLGASAARCGKTEKTKEVIKNMERLQREKPDVFLSHYFALLYLNLGDKDKFLVYYSESIERKLLIAVMYHSTLLMEFAWHDERVRKLRSELGLPNVN
ncbi:MAG TPA: adenylate/guanylate cyclase domain-containing protein [Chitinophagales bacterium]|nr:adenylate/guanylate cyclase domain-containing protein [Chitinophagales bacterium]